VKITLDGWSMIFLAIVVGIMAINMVSPHWVYLWISIGIIISLYFFLSPLFGSKKDMELDELYSQYQGLYEEIKHLKDKKRKTN
jgi:hypothetical protein